MRILSGIVTLIVISAALFVLKRALMVSCRKDKRRQALSSIRFLKTDNVVARYTLANMRLQCSHPTLVRMLQCLRHVTSGTRALFREVAGVASLYIIL